MTDLVGTGHDEARRTEVRQIRPAETWPIRHAVLRPHLPYASCDYDIDNIEGSFHLGLFRNGELVSIASFYPGEMPTFEALNPYRLRGMATLQEEQGRGLGNTLLTEGISVLRSRSSTLLWCNARSSAAGFYRKFGMQTHGEEFEIEGIGPHFLMYVRLAGLSQ